MTLTVDGALRAYAQMMNTLDSSALEPLLADDFVWATQWVFHTLQSKQAYIDYIRPKLIAVKKSGRPVYAEMGQLPAPHEGPCVVLAQGGPESLLGVVLAQVQDGRITRLDLCNTPSAEEALRSGEYPGLVA
jgi:hypothetical protein